MLLGTIATISESQLQFGLLYTGSDDGLIYVSKDGGKLEQNFDQFTAKLMGFKSSGFYT
jgi:hypothetical protein